MTDTLYTVEVQTGKKFGAGTDANVFITLYGQLGRSVEFFLDDKKNNFEKGKTDVFKLDFPQNLGSIGKIKIRHDGSGPGAGWFLEKVTVTDSVNDGVYEFPCHRWLDEGEDDELICRELLCSNLDRKSDFFENLTSDAGKELYEKPITEMENVDSPPKGMDTKKEPAPLEERADTLEEPADTLEESNPDEKSNGSSSSSNGSSGSDTDGFMVVSKADVAGDKLFSESEKETILNKSVNNPVDVQLGSISDNEEIEKNVTSIDELKKENPESKLPEPYDIEETDADKSCDNTGLLEESDISVNVDNIENISSSGKGQEVESKLDSGNEESESISSESSDDDNNELESDPHAETNKLIKQHNLESWFDDDGSHDVGPDTQQLLYGGPPVDIDEPSDRDNSTEVSFIDVEKDLITSIDYEKIHSAPEDISSAVSTHTNKPEPSLLLDDVTIQNIDKLVIEDEPSKDVEEAITDNITPHQVEDIQPESIASSFIKVDEEAEVIESASTVTHVSPDYSDPVSACDDDQMKSFVEVDKEVELIESVSNITHVAPDYIDPVSACDDDQTKSFVEVDKEAAMLESASNTTHVIHDFIEEAISLSPLQAIPTPITPEQSEDVDSNFDSLEIIEAPTSLLAESIKDQINVSEVTKKSIEEITKDDVPVKPEELTIDILGNGKLIKTLIKPGKGINTRPKNGDQVIISYDASTEDGTIVETDKKCNMFVQEGDVIPGLDIAIQLMELGEVSSIKIAPQFAYGESGRAPSIEPNSTLIYNVELLENLGHPDFHSMPVKSRIELAEKRRSKGNELFSKQEYGDAIMSYTNAQKILKDDGNITSEEKSELEQCLVKCLNNQAICQIKIEAYGAAVKSCDSVLLSDPKNVKAMFRKGKAHYLSGDFMNAVKSLSEANKLDPSNKETVNLLKEAKDKLMSDEKKVRDMYQKMLGTDNKDASTSKSNIVKSEKFPMWAVCSGTAFAAGIAVISWALYQLFAGDD